MRKEDLKNEFPELLERWNKLTKEQLINELIGEVTDLFNMNDRVSLFMQECTNNMSYTTYTLDVIKNLIREKKELDIKEWCDMVLEDSEGNDNYIIKEVKETAKF